MTYKALIFDIDGTAVIYKQRAKPSTRLIDAVQKAKEKVFICTATGRMLNTAKWVIDPFHLTSPCIISAGAKIVDPQTGAILWKKVISTENVAKIVSTLSNYPYEYTKESQYAVWPPLSSTPLQEEAIIYAFKVDPKDASEMITKLKKIHDITVHEAPDYTKGKLVFNITHKDATKKHALEELIQLLHVKKEEIIGVGDSNNDLPLFASVGFKVAMGNATKALKKAADFVAPSIEEDGLAFVIEKFILS